jgi:protein arginine kinase activator
MICEICHQKNADILFKTVTGGQVATRAMCMSCAQDVQQDMMKMFMTLGLQPDQDEALAVQEETRFEMPRFLCTGCGRPFSHLGEHTMAGCANCYEAMEEELEAHFSASNTPAIDQVQARHKDAVAPDSLRFRLMEAIVREDFEAAAELRNQIQEVDNILEDNR